MTRGLRPAFGVVLYLLLTALSPAQAPTAWTEFETGPVHPIRVSADGTRLYVLNLADGRLSVHGLSDPDRPVLLREVRVGLEPISLTEAPDGLVWVADHLSDAVSVVDPEAGRVIDVVQTGDEPSDVAFANGRAFVTCASEDRVQVFDLATRQPLGEVAIFSKHPRAMAVAPGGDAVYVIAQRSGNGTTILPKELAPPPLALPWLPAPPQTALIVRADDPAWAPLLPITLPDHDLFEIDAQTLAITSTVSGIGTTLFDLAVDPIADAVLVANTEARNHVPYEPVLRGHVIDSRVTHVAMGGVAPFVTPIDLNPDAAYAVLPDAASIATSLAEPTGLVLDVPARRLWVAAQGSDRVAVFDADTAALIARLDLRAPGADTAAMRGPRGLALHPAAGRLYVLNRMANTVTVIDAVAPAVIREIPTGGLDPTPAAVKLGRRFLYDARLSGNGTMSCASCHVDGDTDGLAWDLGDPGGAMLPPFAQPVATPFDAFLQSTHPMKGPMSTQTMRGIVGTGPLHWRGDRADLADFNPAFDGLLGGDEIDPAEMAAFEAWAATVVHPPNPHRALDDALRPGPETQGFAAFNAPVAPTSIFGPVSCASCHAGETGTNGAVIPLQTLAADITQQTKVAHLRGLWRREGMAVAGPSKSGFGFLHDAVIPDLSSIFDLPIFTSWTPAQRADVVHYLEVFRGDCAPLTGRRLLIEPVTVGTPEVGAALALLEQQAAVGAVDAVLQGEIGGVPRGFWRDPQDGSWRSDRGDETPTGLLEVLLELAAEGGHLVAFATPPGRGRALGIDRDDDGDLDGDEAGASYGHATSACGTPSALEISTEARVGGTEFALVARGVPPGAEVVFAVSTAPDAASIGPLAVWIDVASLLGATSVVADARGVAALRIPMPTQAAAVGLVLHAQAIFLDPCAVAPAGTPGLTFRIGS